MNFKRIRLRLSSSQVIILGFMCVILMGSLLLSLPFATQSGKSAGFLDALFTATSSVCVTGLVVHNTATYWSAFGQAVILMLIQIGGMGVITAAAAFAMISGRKISLMQRSTMQEAIAAPKVGGIVRLTGFIVRTTLVIELAGAAVMAPVFCRDFGVRGLWMALFHAVSAFCNAGFDLFGPGGAGSLSSYSRNPVVLLTVCVLVMAGGLGFFVWEELLHKRSYRGLSLYSRMVIWLTAALVVLGWLFFFCAERSNMDTLGGMPVWQQILNALFQSVTLRTAGFTAIDQGALTDVSQVICILYMLVGGSSGSTAGGVKTVTVGVLLLALREGLRGRECVTFRGRAIPQQKVLSALTLTLVVGGMLLVCSVLIALADGIPYLTAAYEAASALGTVGLSMGITAELSLFSRLLLIAVMYLGRVGILSFSVAFMGQSGGKSKLRYPETMVMIG